jgi:hypothetical protein
MSWVMSPRGLSKGVNWVMSWVMSPRGLSGGELGDELGDEPSGSE